MIDENHCNSTRHRWNSLRECGNLHKNLRHNHKSGMKVVPKKLRIPSKVRYVILPWLYLANNCSNQASFPGPIAL